MELRGGAAWLLDDLLLQSAPVQTPTHTLSNSTILYDNTK
jgi:hypothetical protein